MTVAARLRTYGGLVAFSHTVFAMPFAASAVVLSRAEPGVLPLTPARIVAMLVCLVAARTSAMAWNRWVDRDVDAQNPRTRDRHIPAGAVPPAHAFGLAMGSGLLFLASAATLGRWPALLAPPVLGILLGYSLAKRFTWGAHAWLGVALALAPGGAWIASGAAPGWGIIALMVAVLTWLLGFDILYSLQDEHFDRAQGLHSIPARFGLTRALWASGLAHVATVMAMAAAGALLHRGPAYFTAVAACGAILAWEHALVGRGNLARINKAFFDANAYVSVAFFVLTLLDEVVRLRAHA